MTTNFREFSKEMDGLKDEIKLKVSNAIKDVVNEIFKALLEPKFAGGTPKVTGWLRSNWLVTINVPANGPVGSQEDIDKTTRQRLIDQFNEYPPEVIMSTNSIIFNNEVPYGVYVNLSQNFVERSTQRGLNRLNGVIK